ncbi:hypothetical protein Hanom_Chr11g00971051 [Helianthus anomalus]
MSFNNVWTHTISWSRCRWEQDLFFVFGRYFHRLLLWSSFIKTVTMEIGQNPIDIDKTKKILEPDKTSGSGWHLSGKKSHIQTT